MSAPNVKARSSVEIDNSCNGPFCCFGRKKHKKRAGCDEKVKTAVSVAQLQIVNPDQIPRTKALDEREWAAMPALQGANANVDVSKQAEGSK